MAVDREPRKSELYLAAAQHSMRELDRMFWSGQFGIDDICEEREVLVLALDRAVDAYRRERQGNQT